jgi:hypothetical protein
VTSVNWRHIMLGEIRAGRPVGFHFRSGQNSRLRKVQAARAEVVSIKYQPDVQGVFGADVRICDAPNRTWLGKYSTFFPDSWSVQELRADVLGVVQGRAFQPVKSKYGGGQSISHRGLLIRWYFSASGQVDTAFPLR